MQASCEISGKIGVMIRKNGERRLPHVLGVAFRGATLARPPGLRVSQPEGMSPVNQNLYKVRVFMGHPGHSSLGFPGIFPF